MELLLAALSGIAGIIAIAWKDMRPFRALLRLYGSWLLHTGLALTFSCIAISLLRQHWRWFASINHWPTSTELEIGMLIGTCLYAAPVYLIAILVIVERVKTEADREAE
jgi:hypothetical protein